MVDGELSMSIHALLFSFTFVALRFSFGVFNTGLFISPWLRCTCTVELIICDIRSVTIRLAVC